MLKIDCHMKSYPLMCEIPELSSKKQRNQEAVEQKCSSECYMLPATVTQKKYVLAFQSVEEEGKFQHIMHDMRQHFMR